MELGVLCPLKPECQYCWKTIWLYITISFSFQSTSSKKIWNGPQNITSYERYLSLNPLRFTLPDGLDKVKFMFLIGKSRPECPEKEMHFKMQRGGLPLIRQTALSFPSDFLVEEDSTLSFSTRAGDLLRLELDEPLPGAWFLVAYDKDVDDKIQQKGLTGEPCKYSYISQVEWEDPEYYLDVTVTTQTELNLEFSDAISYVLLRRQLYFGLNNFYGLSFRVKRSIFMYTVKVLFCAPKSCNVTLTSMETLGLTRQSRTIQCMGQIENCSLTIMSPSVSSLQKLEIVAHTVNLHIRLAVFVESCTFAPELFTHDLYETHLLPMVKELNATCIMMEPLDRLQFKEPLTAMFGYINDKEVSLNFSVSSLPVVLPFTVKDPIDIGATLSWKLKLVDLTDATVHICAALTYEHLPPFTSEYDLCSHDASVKQTVEDDTELLQHVPYPRGGLWHLSVKAVCVSGPNCPTLRAEALLAITPCLNKGCSDRGRCELTLGSPDMVIFSSCTCKAQFAGYACTDDNDALTVAQQLEEAYLLTLSNLFFLPGIFVAVRRGFLAEATAYLYTMFFSTFYHACEGLRLQRYTVCIMPFNLLQEADFLGGVCSLWVTLVTMASIPRLSITHMLHIMGPLLLLIGIVIDKHSLLTIAIPMSFGFFIIFISWGCKMRHRRALYPTKKRYIKFLAPGSLLIITAALCFGIFQTKQNYRYVHSVWHTCVSLSICLFLPPKRPQEQERFCFKKGSDNGLRHDAKGVCQTLSSVETQNHGQDQKNLESAHKGDKIKNHGQDQENLEVTDKGTHCRVSVLPTSECISQCSSKTTARSSDLNVVAGVQQTLRKSQARVE